MDIDISLFIFHPPELPLFLNALPGKRCTRRDGVRPSLCFAISHLSVYCRRSGRWIDVGILRDHGRGPNDASRNPGQAPLLLLSDAAYRLTVVAALAVSTSEVVSEMVAVQVIVPFAVGV
jgi:hypothetical protein